MSGFINIKEWEHLKRNRTINDDGIIVRIPNNYIKISYKELKENTYYVIKQGINIYGQSITEDLPLYYANCLYLGMKYLNNKFILNFNIYSPNKEFISKKEFLYHELNEYWYPNYDTRGANIVFNLNPNGSYDIPGIPIGPSRNISEFIKGIKSKKGGKKNKTMKKIKKLKKHKKKKKKNNKSKRK